MIIAVDFDGVLCESRFPEIGAPDYEVVSLVRQLIDSGAEVVLWTSRAGKRLTEAVEWCADRGLRFCAVNENAPSNRERYAAEYPEPSPKVYADVYVEDHDLLYRKAGRRSRETARRAVVEELNRLVKEIGDEDVR